jgi:LCP family protein required for cell wall assembly
MVGVVAAVNRGIDDRVAKIERVKLAVAPAPPEGANFLIIGSDTRAFVDNADDANAYGDATTEGGQRSDTLMVAHVEPGAQSAYVVSFPRDLMVNVPGIRGKTRINAAYANGGPQLVIDTLKNNFDIDINHYLEVDFKTFQAVVQAIGSVKVYLPGELRDDSPDSTSGFHSTGGAGCYALDPLSALQYVRSRHMQIADPKGNIVDENGKRWRLLDVRADLDRIQRQQSFVRELAAVAIKRSLGDPFTAIELADNVLGYLKVDAGFGRDDVNQLVRAFRTVNIDDSSSVQFTTIPVVPDPNNPNVTVVPAPDADTVLNVLRTFGNNTPKPPTVPASQVKIEVQDGTGTEYAARVATALQGQGFGSARAGTPVKRAVDGTEIRYGTNQAAAAMTLLAYVPDAKLIVDPTLASSPDVVLVLGKGFTGITVPSTSTTAPAAGEAAPVTTAPATTTTTTPPSQACRN